jgi:hypothetical protein
MALGSHIHGLNELYTSTVGPSVYDPDFMRWGSALDLILATHVGIYGPGLTRNMGWIGSSIEESRAAGSSPTSGRSRMAIE